MNYVLKDDKQVRERVRTNADRMIADIFGYNALLFGEMFGYDFMQGSRIAKKWRVSDSFKHNEKIDLITDSKLLGVGAETIDLIILPYILESVKSPFVVLENMADLLVSDGYLLLIGVNSWSFGRNNCFSELNSIVDSEGAKLFTMRELSSALNSCNLVIEQTEFLYFGGLFDCRDKSEEKRRKFIYRRIVVSLGYPTH